MSAYLVLAILGVVVGLGLVVVLLVRGATRVNRESDSDAGRCVPRPVHINRDTAPQVTSWDDSFI